MQKRSPRQEQIARLRNTPRDPFQDVWERDFNISRKTARRTGAAFLAFWFSIVVANLVVWGVVIWAIISLVQWVQTK